MGRGYQTVGIPFPGFVQASSFAGAARAACRMTGPPVRARSPHGTGRDHRPPLRYEPARASVKECTALNKPSASPAVVPPAAYAFGANSLRTGPNERGRFGAYGGRFVAET